MLTQCFYFWIARFEIVEHYMGNKIALNTFFVSLEVLNPKSHGNKEKIYMLLVIGSMQWIRQIIWQPFCSWWYSNTWQLEARNLSETLQHRFMFANFRCADVFINAYCTHKCRNAIRWGQSIERLFTIKPLSKSMSWISNINVTFFVFVCHSLTFYTFFSFIAFISNQWSHFTKEAHRVFVTFIFVRIRRKNIETWVNNARDIHSKCEFYSVEFRVQ